MERREALEAAFEKLEAGDEDTTTTTTEPEKVEGETQEVQASTSGEEDTQSTSNDGLESRAKEAAAHKKSTDEALDRAAQASASTAVDKPPVSWKPAAKEAWTKLPPEARAEISRREREMSQFISQNDHHKRFTESFAKIVQPYSHLIQAQGSTPLQAVRNVFSTMAALTTGNREQKARVIAEIISNYDIDIPILDKVLSGEAGQPTQQRQGTMDPSVLQALQPMYAFMDEIKSARQANEERKRQEAEAAIQQHESLPYFDDLREDMADIMEVAAKRGIELSLEQAYERAVALNPEISKIVQQKKAIEEAKKNGGTRMARARRAASTISGAPAGSPDGKSTPKSRREQIEAAWDDANLQ